MAPMSNAERQKKYREKLKLNNPEKYEEKRVAHLKKVKSNKKKISELTHTEQQKTREKWKTYSAKYYLKQKEGNKISEEDEKINRIYKKWQQKTRKMRKQISLLKDTAIIEIKRNRCLKKQVMRLKKKIETLSQNKMSHTQSDDECCLLLDTCKHKSQSKAQSILDSTPINEGLTPRKKTEMFINSISSFDEVNKAKLKEKIMELNVLSDSLKENYKTAGKNEKNIIKKIVKNPITQKYKKVTQLSKMTIGLSGRIRKSGKIERKRAARIKEIHDFYNRDDVTRCTAGKKETKTKNKEKVQRKYLLDSIKELHKKYKENGGKASYTSLLRHRPFYVLNPKLESCDTCVCIKHANFKFKILKLYKLGVIKSTNVNEILKEISCDLNSKPCMYNECNLCSRKTNNIEADSAATTEVTWLQWNFKKVQYKKTDKDGKIENLETKKYKKEVMESSLQELIYKFKEEAILFKKHIFNINHQQNIFKMSRMNIRDDEVVLICDFSENYLCRYHSEIQGMHFGSSRNQISLHTGVVYIKNQKPTSFCTLSPSNEHNPFSIWAHLSPILNDLKAKFPQIHKIHFFSDGPSTQYRQKLNFILFSKLTKRLGFKHCTWNYFESAHGKNAADGIGGAIKRNLDKHVAYGVDIPDADAAFKLFKRISKISLYFVTESDIQSIKENLNDDTIKPLKGTMSVHQIITTEDEACIKYRDVSCLCGEIRGHCMCFNIKKHFLTNRTNAAKVTDPVNENEHATNKNINRKVTLLSDIKLTEENTKFFAYTPSSLREIKINTDLVSLKTRPQKSIVNKQSAIQNKSRKRRKSSLENHVVNENKKSPKRRKRSSSMTTTSESGEISLHSDSDVLNALSDLDYLSDASDYSGPDKTKCATKVKEKANKEELTNNTNIRDLKLQQVYEKKIKHSEENNQNNFESCMKVNDELKEISKTVESLQKSESEKELESIDKIDKTQEGYYSIGDTVLVRYYIKNSWKYYTGVIENICVAEQLYTISFYKTVGKKDNLKFCKPFRQDKDTVPEKLVVKIIELMQTSKKPEEYILLNEEDQIFF